VYGAGLLQVGAARRHATVRGAWWRPTVPRGELHQVSSSAKYCRRVVEADDVKEARCEKHQGSSRRHGLLDRQSE
jgi:hypothetical protein